MTRWTVEDLTKNIRRRFSDPLLSIIKLSNGQIQVRRRSSSDKNKFFTLLKLSSDASKDYIFKRLYEMDTWNKTLSKTDLDQDNTSRRIEARERAISDIENHKKSYENWMRKRA